jgi:membrane-associated phospholipid phosphatase
VLGSTFTRGLFSRANLPALGVGVAGTAVVYPFDQQWSDAWGGRAPGVGRAADLIGGPIVAAAAGGMLVTAPFTHNTRFRATSFTMTQALVLETALTQGLKFAVGRTRPNGSNTHSFPSGHTADTFMAATVLNHYLGWKVGIPAYAVATLVAAGRIESLDHYPSDTVAGAAIGYLSAESAVRAVGRDAEGRVTVAPLLGRHQAGIFVAITF